MKAWPLLLLAVAGCAATDPLTRAGAWHPTGANDANLRTTVADPRDLVAGAVSPLADGAVAASAVARYRAGRIRPLPDAGLTTIAVQGGGSNNAAAAGGQN